MFGIRRYRLFLLVAALSAATIYYLSRSASWTFVDLDRFDRSSTKSDIQKPQGEDSVAQSPPSPPPPPPAPAPIPPALPDPVRPYLAPGPTKPAPETVVVPPPTKPDFDLTNAAKPADKPAALPTLAGQPSQDFDLEGDFAEEGSSRWELDTALKDGRKPKWLQPEAHFPLAEDEIIELPAGPAQQIPNIQAKFRAESAAAKKDRISKLSTIKESFKHAWNGYTEFGFPHDELRPVTKGFADPFMGWGATLVDTLDTLWIMGLKQEFEHAVLEVGKIDFHSSMRKDLPLFETVIRYLGGLLGAYDVSGAKYPVLLTKAEELAALLMGAFDTPNRMPLTFYNWAPSYTSQPHRASAHTVMAELGSLSMELTRLAQITRNNEYYDAIARITNELEKLQSETLIPGLWPLKVDASGCKKSELDLVDAGYDEETDSLPVLIDSKKSDLGAEPAIMPAKVIPKKYGGEANSLVKRERVPVRPKAKAKGDVVLKEVDQDVLAVECLSQGLAPEPNARIQTFGIGGQADSTYEYLPKMHQLLRGRSKQYKSMYIDSAKAIRDNLLFRPMIQDSDREILFASKHNLSPKAKTAKKRKEILYETTHLSCFVGGMFGLGSRIFGIESDLELAKQLTDGCVWAYESMPTGVMAEVAQVVPCPSLEVCPWSEKMWHDALDAHQEERFLAVDAWNKNQKEIYEKSRNEALKEAAVDRELSGPRPTEVGGLDEREPVKRQNTNEEPSGTLPKLYFEERASPAEPVSASINFVPKVALAHEKFVKARIQEERLPPSYTKISSRYYSLRPEAIESVFYMYRLTGDDIWRQKGWKMFEAVQSATQTEVANAGMKDVTSNLGELEDSMESFWLAETLKYFYLLFSEPDVMNLDKWVSNTEAHFFRIPA